MSWRNRIRPLYMLALFQLVAGPLVLFSVTILCQQTVREMAHHSVAEAVSLAWKSPEFQAALTADVNGTDRSKSSLPGADPAKVKMPAAIWHAVPVVLANPSRRAPMQDYARRWTPTLPLPPPGPPPRVG